MAEFCAPLAHVIESDWHTDHQVRFDGKAATAGSPQICSLSACDLSRTVCV